MRIFDLQYIDQWINFSINKFIEIVPLQDIMGFFAGSYLKNNRHFKQTNKKHTLPQALHNNSYRIREHTTSLRNIFCLNKLSADATDHSVLKTKCYNTIRWLVVL